MVLIKLAKTFVAAVAVAGALAGASAVSAPVVHAAPAPPPAPEVPPTWAPRKPAETWLGQPVVWWSGDPTPGGHWGVWINGGFLNLS